MAAIWNNVSGANCTSCHLAGSRSIEAGATKETMFWLNRSPLNRQGGRGPWAVQTGQTVCTRGSV